MYISPRPSHDSTLSDQATVVHYMLINYIKFKSDHNTQ